MQMLFATQFAGEIDAVSDGGDALLRDRIAALGEVQRRLLRDALETAALAASG
jgi:hypothetical protein